MFSSSKIFVSSIRRGAAKYWWVGHAYELVCINPATGRAGAMITFRDTDAYSLTLFVSLLDAFEWLFADDVGRVDLRAFPRCAVHIALTGVRDMVAAKDAAENFMKDYDPEEADEV